MPFARIVSVGWETFTGSMGHQAVFHNGVSVNELNARQIARIGSTVTLVDADTGEQLGPSAMLQRMQFTDMVVAPVTVTQAEKDADAEAEREKLAAAEAERVAAEKVALEEARAKAEADIVVYSRVELEAIGANDGIQGLRDIAAPLGVRGRAIAELVEEILKAQSAKVSG